MDKIKVILSDDHQMFRDGVKSILNDEDGIEVIGEVGRGQDLIELLGSVTPDLLITDISMPGMSGLEISEYIAKNHPGIKVLILSMHVNEEFIVKALETGASGYLPKDTSMNELLEAIYAINKGDNYYNKDISNTVLKSLMRKSGSGDKRDQDVALTGREMEILRNVVEGYTNKEIARILCISIRTVDSHKNNIMHKLNLKSSVELVKYAIKNNLVSID